MGAGRALPGIGHATNDELMGPMLLLRPIRPAGPFIEGQPGPGLQVG